MRKYLMAGAAVVLSAGVASAATWNFEVDAVTFQQTEGFEGTFDQVYNGGGVTDGLNEQGGITVEASAFNTVSGEADPFMDSLSKRRPAGIGVCSSGFDASVEKNGSGAFGGMSNCSTQFPSGPGKASGDDNLFGAEVLVLDFSKAIVLEGLKVRDKDHFLANGTIMIGTSLGTMASYIIVNGQVQGEEGLGKNTTYYFSADASQEPGTEIYVSQLSSVPVPAAGFLLLGALGGMAAMRRRKTA